MKLYIALFLSLFVSLSAADPKDPTEKDPISEYLIDITGGAVSAAGLIGIEKTAITQIQTAQDFVVAIQPFTSNGQKAGFGLAFTPARTKFFPVSGRAYYDNGFIRLLSNITLSFAQASREIDKKNYSQSGYSVDTYYYVDRDMDPAIIDSIVWKSCADKTKSENLINLGKFNDAYPPGQPRDPKAQQDLDKITQERDKGLRACQDKVQDSKKAWNASRLSLSFGKGHMVRDADGDKFSLGESLTLNGMFSVGTKGAVNVSLRRTSGALDVDSLNSATANYRSSKLAGIRFTYGDLDDTSLRAIVETSNSKSSSASAFRDVFMYAAGLDKKIMDGMWLEFRLGRNHSNENGKEQTAALMKLNVLPSLLPWSKK